MLGMNTKHMDLTEWEYSEEEADFDNMEWFKDPPPEANPGSAAATPVPQAGEPFEPPQDVVEENHRFTFALQHAPNVLLTRFKQYGQLGVLGWCSEFSELIDNLKQLGFNGNMFIATREQALRTCGDILRLQLDIRMQIIVMYLSSQVARLRRFLDGEKNFDDYPETDFPVDQRQYTAW